MGPEERVIFLTDRSDFAQLLKDEGCMTHSMTHAADPLAQLEGRREGGRSQGTSSFCHCFKFLTPGETFCILSSSSVGAVSVAEGDLRFLSYRLATSAG